MTIGVGVKVKVCGITNLEDALKAVIAGADALGFVFYKKSPRYIAIERASAIIKSLPKRITKVGVFVNARTKDIRKAAKLCQLDILQLHGNETPELCSKFKGYKVIKAFRIKNKFKPEDILKYKVFAYLLDTYSKSRFGGTGKKFNWGLASGLKKLARPVFLSGGLNARNVSRAVSLLNPDWVDVSTSVEKKAGIKNHKLIKAFIKAAKKG